MTSMTKHELLTKCDQTGLDYDIYTTVDDEICVEIYRSAFCKDTYVFEPVFQTLIDSFREYVDITGEISSVPICT